MDRDKNDSALIVLNGQPCSPELAQKLSDQSAFTICADGAYNWYSNFKLRIDVVAGDMDSIIKEIPENIKSLRLPDQNKTDFEKIIDYLISSGFTYFSVIGSTGKEDDHFLSNLFVLSNFSEQISFRLLDDEQSIILVNDKRFSFSPNNKNVKISVFGWPTASFHHSSGLKYPLNGLTLDFHHFGSRNQCTEREFIIEKSSGRYLIFINEKPHL